MTFNGVCACHAVPAVGLRCQQLFFTTININNSGISVFMPERRQGSIKGTTIIASCLPNGKVIGKRWKIVKRLGKGGFGAVYKVKDMGFIHRDIKPANMALGTSERSRIIHIFDFGLARQYVIFPKKGRPKLRRPRERARFRQVYHASRNANARFKKRSSPMFRGTLRYCSINAQERGEQGRPDDLWGLLYMLAEMRGKLPWDHLE
ncbi:hypothetical protein TELCIR_04184 [Teladorsagia circumcincta]|uniref:Protein kinase domain-containing protein n=1 Tax=Teladorsagia circumcincta TaxID=45464 RepID=A0A2G9UWE9_TELCI|nr:hypothetical protein TELCIR_04184 [Teladorsagia circumcincta]